MGFDQADFDVGAFRPVTPVDPNVFSRDDYRECLPFVEGEYWHAVVGAYAEGTGYFRFPFGQIFNGWALTAQPQDHIHQLFLHSSTVVVLQIGSIDNRRNPMWRGIRARMVIVEGVRHFFVRSTEVLLLILSPGESVTFLRLKRFREFYHSVHFSYDYGQPLKLIRSVGFTTEDIDPQQEVNMEDFLLKNPLVSETEEDNSF